MNININININISYCVMKRLESGFVRLIHERNGLTHYHPYVYIFVL